MKCRGWQVLKANKNKGISMAVMLCVAAFFIAFATAILYTAGLVTSQSTQRLKQERCYQLAKSYAQVIDKELTRYENKQDGSVDGTFYKFANRVLDNSQYSEYDEDGNTDNTQYTYMISDADLTDLSKAPSGMEGYGNLSITLRKEKNSDEESNMKGWGDVLADTTGYEEWINSVLNTSVRQYTLIVDVTAYYENLTYTYTTEYVRAEKYTPQFTNNGRIIVWYDGMWHDDTTAGSEHDFTGDDKITYTFDVSQATESKFINTRTEGGNGDGNS